MRSPAWPGPALLADLAMVVHAFPIDGDLPALVPATDPTLMGLVLAEAIGRDGATAAGGLRPATTDAGTAVCSATSAMPAGARCRPSCTASSAGTPTAPSWSTASPTCKPTWPASGVRVPSLL